MKRDFYILFIASIAHLHSMTNWEDSSFFIFSAQCSITVSSLLSIIVIIIRDLSDNERQWASASRREMKFNISDKREKNESEAGRVKEKFAVS